MPSHRLTYSRSGCSHAELADPSTVVAILSKVLPERSADRRAAPLLSSTAAVNCSSFVCFALPLSRAVTVCRSLYVAPQHRASGTFNAPHCTVQAARSTLHIAPCKRHGASRCTATTACRPRAMDHRSRPWRWAQLSAAVRRSGCCLFVCASLADCALLPTSLLERAPASDGCPAGLAHSHCH
jgi:hypothetical protein